MSRYSIVVTAGPSLDETTHQCVHINSETYVPVHNEDFMGQVTVRVKDFHGLAPEGCEPIAQSAYFDEAKGMTFSIEASGKNLRLKPCGICLNFPMKVYTRLTKESVPMTYFSA